MAESEATPPSGSPTYLEKRHATARPQTFCELLILMHPSRAPARC